MSETCTDFHWKRVKQLRISDAGRQVLEYNSYKREIKYRYLVFQVFLCEKVRFFKSEVKIF